MSKSVMDSKCVAEKNAVKAILESNQMTMTQIVEDRVKSLYEITKDGVYTERVVIRK